MPEMLPYYDPGFRCRDHRVMSPLGESLEDWRRVTETWWELSPDIRIAELVILEHEGQWFLYRVRLTGTDSFTGGRFEFVLYYATRLAGTIFVETDVFDDRQAAWACFSGRAAATAPAAERG
jgi:hypothetical protein